VTVSLRRSLALVALTWATAAMAQDGEPARSAFKVCEDPNNMPFSNTAGEGIENKLATLFGQALNLPVTYYHFPQRMGFVRNTLRFKLPGQDYPCDIVMGVPVGFEQVWATKPYYRSTYALVVAEGRGLDGVKTVADFLALDKARQAKLRIGLFDRSPASQWLVKHDLVDQGVPYKMLDADPAHYPGELIEKELAAGKIDAAIVWGPLAGYYVKRASNPKMRLIPMASEPGVRFDYAIAMGVRRGEADWRAQIEHLIDTKGPEIRAILTEFGVPLVDE